MHFVVMIKCNSIAFWDNPPLTLYKCTNKENFNPVHIKSICREENKYI